MSGLKTSVMGARITPASIDDLGDEIRAFVEPRYEAADTKNILMTLALNPELIQAWMPITRYTFNESQLEFSDIELICLRTTWLCKADYEFTHHAKLALTRGLSQEQVDSTPIGPKSGVYNHRQKSLLRAVDQLVLAKEIDDLLWVTLEQFYSEQQLMDIIVTCGNYNTISLVQKNLRIQLEAGFPYHPACLERDKSHVG